MCNHRDKQELYRFNARVGEIIFSAQIPIPKVYLPAFSGLLISFATNFHPLCLKGSSIM